jgi:hypothetical protein
LWGLKSIPQYWRKMCHLLLHHWPSDVLFLNRGIRKPQP